jgi:hypothetical protein
VRGESQFRLRKDMLLKAFSGSLIILKLFTDSVEEKDVDRLLLRLAVVNDATLSWTAQAALQQVRGAPKPRADFAEINEISEGPKVGNRLSFGRNVANVVTDETLLFLVAVEPIQKGNRT